MSRLRLNIDLHPAQRAVAKALAMFRFVVLVAGRRFGKSFMALLEAIREVFRGPDLSVLFVSPVFAQCRARFRECLKLIRDLALYAYVESANKSELRITFKNGSAITFASAHDHDRLRGEGHDLVILDEAGYLDAAAWFEVVRPSLADRQGRLLAIGTPRGKGQLLHTLFLRGEAGDPGWRSFRFPSSANPRIGEKEIEEWIAGTPHDVWRQEGLAEFLESNAGVFRRISGCIRGALEGPRSGRRYVAGVDLAKKSDFTVIIVIDAATRQIVHFERVRGEDYVSQVSRIIRVAQQFNGADVVLDQTGVGEGVLDLLRASLGRSSSSAEIERRGAIRRGVGRVTGIVLTSQTKQDVVDKLRLEIERGRLGIPAECRELLAELETFGYEMLPSGRVRYSAPAGFHDDCVIALALATYAVPREGFSLDHIDSRWAAVIEKLRPRVWKPQRFGLPRQRAGWVAMPVNWWQPKPRDLHLEFRLGTVAHAAGLLGDDDAALLLDEIRRKSFATKFDRMEYTDNLDRELGSWRQLLDDTHPLIAKEKSL